MNGFFVSDCPPKLQTKLIKGKAAGDSLVVVSVFLSPRFRRLVSSINVLLCASNNAT